MAVPVLIYKVRCHTLTQSSKPRRAVRSHPDEVSRSNRIPIFHQSEAAGGPSRLARLGFRRRVDRSSENDVSWSATRKSLFLTSKSELLARKSLFLMRKSELLARKSHFPDEQKRIAHEEIAFADEQKRIADKEIAFADEQKRIAHEEIAFPDEQKRNAREEIAFPDCGLRSGS